MIRAVLDTNIVISAHLRADGREALILELALARAFTLCISELLVQEYEGVLRRPRFGLDTQRISRSLSAIRNVADRVKPSIRLKVTSDPDDNKVLECALEGRAHYIVTGNIRHFPKRYQGISVVRPREFVTILAADLN